MTDTMAPAPPLLYLPTSHLAEAEACLDRARAALASAAQVEWVSVAQHHYLDELAGLDAHLGAIAAAVDHARDRVISARLAAYGEGQL